MKTRPWLPEEVGPPAPTLDMKASTFGSFASTAATACWCSFMASKERPSAPSVVPVRKPVSSLGMNPLGTTRNRTSVPAKTAADSSSVARLRRIASASVRS